MFKIPRTNVVESDEGFSVEVLGRTGILYEEGKRQMRIDSEVLMGSPAMSIYSFSINKWLPPFEDDQVTSVDQERIMKNIQSAFLFRGIEVDFQ